MVNFLLPFIRRSGGDDYELRNVVTGRLIAHTIIPAFESATRRKGLLGCDSLADGAAMIIAPTNAIHTFGMRFPIDVVFVRRNGEVVKIRERVMPWRVAIAHLAYAVIELPAGTVAHSQLKVGDVVAVMSCQDLTEKFSHEGEKVLVPQTPAWGSDVAPDLSATATGV
jgi:uncharacterized membrane protein (UPF0127 family)